MAARRIDENRFKQCVTEAEKNGGLATLGDLYEKVAALYNLAVPANMKPITDNIAKSNINEFKLPIKTVNGRAKAAAVDMAALKTCVLEAEKGGPLENRTALFAVVATAYNGKTGQSCSGATLQALVNKEGWELITPRGKPGGRKPGQTVVRRSRAEKLNEDSRYGESVRLLRKTIPLDMLPRLEKTVEKAAQGSLTARIKLKCLDCCAFQPIEVRECPSMDCSLWPIRPYRGKSDDTGDGDDPGETTIEIPEEGEATFED
jgi:hypothetical protein